MYDRKVTEREAQYLYGFLVPCSATLSLGYYSIDNAIASELHYTIKIDKSTYLYEFRIGL